MGNRLIINVNLKTHEIKNIIELNQVNLIISDIDKLISHIIKYYGRESIQFYFHYIDFHFIEIIESGISLCLVQQQAVEHSHSVHKSVQRNMTSNESGFHRTPSFCQILMRQMRIFVLENNIFKNEIDGEIDFIYRNLLNEEDFNLD